MKEDLTERNVERDMTQTNKEGLTLEEWTNSAQAFGARLPTALAKIAWCVGTDPTEYAACAPVFGARGGEPIPHELLRELLSMPDSALVEVEKSKNVSDVWYAKMRGGSYMSDPDFGTAARSPQDAAKFCAEKIRADVMGIGKYAPHFGLYDLGYRLMPEWRKATQEDMAKESEIPF